MIDEPKLHALWARFHHAVNKATYNLFALLYGAELLRRQETPKVQNTPTDDRQRMDIQFAPSILDVYPQIKGVDFVDTIKGGGDMEQIAYRGWIVELYGIWEDQYRNRLETAIHTPDSIRPRIRVMGDFRHIRNDLVHNNSVASEKESGKCELLKWFTPGAQIMIGIRHVLDFMHQLGFVSGNFVIGDNAEGSLWRIPSIEELRSRQPLPKIVSVRVALLINEESDELWFAFSLLYSNGFLSKHACSSLVKNSASGWETLHGLISETLVTPDGDLDGPVMNGKAEDIYLWALDRLERYEKGEQPPEFPRGGFLGPWVQFRTTEEDT